MNKTVLISLPIEQLETVIIDCINSCLKNHNRVNIISSGEPEEKLLTVKETAKFLSLSVPTIYSKVSRTELPFMKRGKRLYFSQKDLVSYLKQGRVKSTDELRAEADAYLSNSKTTNNGKR